MKRIALMVVASVVVSVVVSLIATWSASRLRGVHPMAGMGTACREMFSSHHKNEVAPETSESEPGAMPTAD